MLRREIRKAVRSVREKYGVEVFETKMERGKVFILRHPSTPGFAFAIAGYESRTLWAVKIQGVIAHIVCACCQSETDRAALMTLCEKQGIKTLFMRYANVVKESRVKAVEFDKHFETMTEEYGRRIVGNSNRWFRCL